LSDTKEASQAKKHEAVAPQVSGHESDREISSNDLSSEQLNIKADFHIDESEQYLLGPAARRLLKSHHIHPNLITGTGHHGRVTRNDVRNYIQNAPMANATSPINSPTAIHMPVARPLQGTMVKHTNMRKSIAKHMVNSLLETSPHVTSVFEMDMSNIIEHRKWHKTEYAELGVKLTFTAYFLAAIVKAVKEVPQVNARFHEEALELFSDVNIGVGTALGDKGLVVPVVQQVQSMNLFSIAQALNVQTEKARSGNIAPSDMKNGTFTISNHGVSGSLFATPIIINQPEVAILGIGKLEKRVCVEEVAGVDTMVIKPKCYVSLSIDHRALDAHQTNMFLAKFVDVIENWGN
jgi:2-oxoglutarate dehydrogenase E2 component (dihydrolipoamide succinyltransferase)